MDATVNMAVGSAILDKQYPQAGMKPKREKHLKRYETELMESSLLSSLIIFIDSC